MYLHLTRCMAAMMAALLLSLSAHAAAPETKSKKDAPKAEGAESADAAKSGDAALPPLELANAAKVKELLQAAKGKVVVLNFWATWCPPCVEETPYFVELYKKYKDKDFAFISLSADGPEAKDKAVKKFQEKHQLPFPVYVLDGLDPNELKEVLGKELSGALPETIVYDKTGALKTSVEGALSYEELEGMVKPLL